MANDIYTTTLGGLAALVSPRVAEGVLRRALSAVDATPEDVDARTMSRLLRGRIRRELERSLPAAGLRRSLADLDRRIGARSGTEAASAPAPAASVPTPGGRIGRAFRSLARGAPAPNGRAHAEARPAAPARPIEWRREPADDSPPETRARAFPIATDADDTAASSGPASFELPPREEPGTAPAPIPSDTEPPRAEPAPGVPASAAAAPERPAASDRPVAAVEPATWPGGAAVADRAVRATPRTHPRPLPAAAMDRLAELAGVRQWVWASGGPTQGQGDGPDPERVAADVRAVLALLSRHGRVTSVHVHHDTGHVLIGATADASLVVSGDEGVNLGAVHTTFRALEEKS